MRRGRTVEIKRLKRPPEPFVILPANCSTLYWPQLQRSCPQSSWMIGG